MATGVAQIDISPWQKSWQAKAYSTVPWADIVLVLPVLSWRCT